MLLSHSILVFWLGFACAFAGRAQSGVARSVEGTDPEVVFAYISKSKAGESIPATVSTSSQQVPAYKCAVARQVFDALVEAKGNRAMQRPDLVMTQSELFAAWMDAKRVAIGLEEKAYDVCAGFGAEWH